MVSLSREPEDCRPQDHGLAQRNSAGASSAGRDSYGRSTRQRNCDAVEVGGVGARTGEVVGPGMGEVGDRVAARMQLDSDAVLTDGVPAAGAGEVPDQLLGAAVDADVAGPLVVGGVVDRQGVVA